MIFFLQVPAKIECRRCQVTELTQLRYFEKFKSLQIQHIGCQDQVLFLTEYSMQDKTKYYE